MKKSVFQLSLRHLCPRCGQGKLFVQFLRVKPCCDVCGLDLSHQDSADGTATFGIFILGLVVTPLAVWFEFTFDPPLWAHMVLWPVLLLILGYWLLPGIKAMLIALEYKNNILKHKNDATPS